MALPGATGTAGALRVGLFGGSFNPPHLGHLLVAEAVRDQFALDRVLWIVAYRPPHKTDRDMAAASHRLAMTRLAVEGHDGFEASDVELRRGGVSYSVDTIAALQEAHPTTDFALILGGDSLHGFPTWRRPDEIARRVPLLVYHRPGARPVVPDGVPADRVRFCDAPLIGLSSTEIRARRHRGASIRYQVPEPVRTYIHDHGLYG